MALVDSTRYINYDPMMIYGWQNSTNQVINSTKRNPLSRVCKSFEFQSAKASVSMPNNESFEGIFDHNQSKGFTDPQVNNSINQIANISTKSFQNSNKYKTEICKNYEINKFCKWGFSCCFAHGREELRTKIVTSCFSKTKICKNFHKNGFCPYGTRCQYFHFKSNEIYKELLDSLEKRIYFGIADVPKEAIDTILLKSERM